MPIGRPQERDDGDQQEEGRPTRERDWVFEMKVRLIFFSVAGLLALVLSLSLETRSVTLRLGSRTDPSSLR